MEIKYLRLIKTIADEGSIANSADRLFLTQSALSHQLREIEERMGFKIFIRSRNQWTLTAEGQELYELAKRVLDEIASGMQKIESIQSGSKGQIRMSTECYSFYHGMPAFVQKMAMLYPEIEIDMVIEGTHHPVSKILSNELDIAITTSRVEHEELENLALFEDEMFAIMHEEHPLVLKKVLLPHDFANEHLVIHSYPLETVTIYQQFLKPGGVEPRKITAIPMTEVALEMIQANMGIMCMPKWALKSFNLPDTLVFKPLGQEGFVRNHYLIYRKEDKIKSYMADFLQNIEEAFAVDGRK